MKKKPLPEGELTHLDDEGRARMVNVGEKQISHRCCVARCEVAMEPQTLQRISSGDLPKGDVLAVARIAGIQAAKQTAGWIPLAHPLPIDSVEILLVADSSECCVRIQATVESHWRTGVEMEALTGATVAALTVYDMCKALSHEIVLGPARLLAKRGGKRDLGEVA